MDEESLLQKSFLRLDGLIDRERILVLTNQAFVPLVREQLPQVPAHNVVGEPLRRDTAAAVCLAATLARKRFGDSVIATVTADHLIEPVDEFRKSLVSAARGATASGALYTFGIRPTSPATAYGYLETGERLDLDPDVRHFRIRQLPGKTESGGGPEVLGLGKLLLEFRNVRLVHSSHPPGVGGEPAASRPPPRGRCRELRNRFLAPRRWWPVSIPWNRSPSTLR